MRFNVWSTAVLLCMVASLAGCQSDSVDAQLPAPRLSAPVIRAPYTPPPAPRFTYTLPPAPRYFPQPRPAYSAGVPAAWIPSVPLNKWTWIVIHHSDSDYGSAAIIDQWHRTRGFDELGYHFVIGNGTNSGDGQIEVGPRWTKQKWGAHDNALDNRYNTSGIGICLVGNFDKNRPTAAQRKSLVRLVVYLMKTYHVTPSHVVGHGETKTTDCPGRYLSVAQIRAAAAQMVAQGDTSNDPKFADNR